MRSPTDAAWIVLPGIAPSLLEKLSEVVRWEDFRPVLEQVREKERKSNAGRRLFDEVLMFKVLVLQHLYNLSDEQMEYQIRDRYSFWRFLGLPPEGWEDKPAMLRQKDRDARWTKKHGKSHYGYENHVSVDRASKLIRSWDVTSASVHDSQVFEALLDVNNCSADVCADSAHRSGEREMELKEKGWRSHIQRKGMANRLLSEREKTANRRRAKVRARVEHVFGAQEAMGRKVVRTIGLARARVKISLMNLVYNMKRLVWLVGNVRPVRKGVAV